MAEAAAYMLAEEAVVCFVKHHFRYLSRYHENMRNLEASIKNLEKKDVYLRDEVRLAESNSQTVKDGVIAWLGKVKAIKEDAESILEMKASVGSGCWKGWCINVRPRYILSKKAMKKTVGLVTFIDEGAFDPVAHPKRHLGYVTSQIERTTDEDDILVGDISNNSNATEERLESRTILLNDVMRAVRDPEIRMVRIWGMGGIGKTTIAKQVELMARKEQLFNEIAMVEVTQNPDLKLLQLHIAELLGLQITEDDVPTRAKRLGERLRGQSSVGPNKKILLILDNVWKMEDLENAGIPLKDPNSCCNFILTSRYDDICKGLVHEKEFRVDFLSDQEALILFRQSLSNVGGYYDEAISQDLLKECGGLPIAVAAIAGAVNNKMEREWKNVLRKLQSSGIRKGYKAVIKCLEISYDFLEDENLKKFFRLCCLFSKGSDVSIEELTRYGTALRLFDVCEYLCDAREEAFSYVQKLLHSNLFLCSDRANCFKVHDIVWDFAVSAPSSDLFLVNHDSTLKMLPREDSYEDFTSISLLCNKSFQAPESFCLSKLELLRLTGDEETCYVESMGNFFKETTGLYILDISSMTLSSTLMSFQQLSRLRMLSLVNCTYLGGDVSSIGKLNCLEILSFAHSDIKELPIDIKSLKSLRLLDLTMCEKCVIAPDVLSELTSLEELYMREVPLCDTKGSESVFVDIASMSTLVVLHIKIPEDRVQLMNSLFKKLKKFKIFVNTQERTAWEEDQSENILHIRCDSSILLQPGLTSLLQKATRIKLCITQLVTLQPLCDSETLHSELKTLKLESCDDLVCLVNTMGVLEHNFVVPFRHLKVLEISQCHKLEHVLTVSAAKSLCVLETITIKQCSSLNFLLWKERDDEGNIKLPGLKNLYLENLDNLIGCYNRVDAVDFPQLQKLSLASLPLITSLVESESEIVASTNKDASCSNPFFRNKEPDTGCRFPNLTTLGVNSCVRLRHICMPSMANSFGEVQELKIVGCTEFEAIITGKSRQERDNEDGRPQVLLLQKLNYLRLDNLKNLSSIVPKGYTLKWSSLKTLDVSDNGVNLPIQTGHVIERQMLLSGLQNVIIYEMGSLNILCKLIPGGFSCEVTDTNIPCHDQLSSLFSPSLIRAYDHLKYISIGNLDSEVVFNLEDECSVGVEAEITALNKLDYLSIGEMDNMTHVWWKVPRNFKGFHDLTFIYVLNCSKLRYLCSPSIARCLVNLRNVCIMTCDMIEEVVSTANEEVEKEVQKKSDDIVFFPQLQSLDLWSLTRLVCINLGVCGSENIYMEAPNAETTQTLHLEVTSPTSSSISTLICSQKSSSLLLVSMRTDGIRRSWSFFHLTQIQVSECQNMSTLFPPNIQVNLPVLKYLDISECEKLRYVFSSDQALRSLERLEISYCKMLEVIVKDDAEEGGGRSNFVFPTITYVSLTSLLNLNGFCLGKCTFDWPSLTNLEIDDCFKIKNFTSGCSTMPLLDHLVINLMQHNFTEEGGNINTIVTSAIKEDLNNSNNVLEEQYILTRTGFILAVDHLATQRSSWCWRPRYERKYLIREDVSCLERVRPSNSTRSALESKIQMDPEDIDKNDDDAQHHNIYGPRKYDIILEYDNDSKSTNLWLKGYDPHTNTKLSFELVLQDIHQSYPQECVIGRNKCFGDEIFNVNLELSENLSSFIKDIFAREGVQPDFKKYFSTLLSALFPTIKCLDN